MDVYILWSVSKNMYLNWCSRNNQYGNALVTGLLKHMSAATDIHCFGYEFVTGGKR
jgi:hypothetical protein